MTRLIPPPSSSFTDQDIEPVPVLTPALVGDMARMFRQLGIESFRASVVDMGSMAFQAAWTLTDNGEVSDDNPDRPLDSQFPGAMASITQLSQASPDETIVQRLSPRRWSFAWRLDGLHVVLAEARYRDMRSAISEIDTALVRLVCDTGIRSGQGQPLVGSLPVSSGAPDGALHWNGQQERRRSSSLGWTRPVSLGLSVLTAVTALWLSVLAVPEAHQASSTTQAEATKLRAIADSTMVHNLSTAMATGDYGEVQTELSSLESLGYFRSAAVINLRNRIVSLTSGSDGLRIGAEVSAEAAQDARRFDLALGSERYGQLVILKQPTLDGTDSRFGPLRVGSAVVAVLATLIAALLLLRLRRSRRIGD